MKRAALLCLTTWVALTSAMGCNSILGIQERHLAGAGGPGEGGSGGGSPNGCLPEATEIRTGVIQVDGLLDAADTMISTFEQIETDFQTRMLVLAEALSIDTGGVYSSDLVDAVIAAMSDDAAAYSATGVAVFVEEVHCSADVELALEQQNRCEEEAGCDTSVESTEVECSGLCLGDCAGVCESCRAPSTDSCSEQCLGVCQLDMGGFCPGLCDGSCSANCTEEGANGCAGACDGDCQGACELFVQDTCTGLCQGECTSSSTTECPSDAACVGHCEGLCAGDCIGRPVPIPGDPACDSAAHCATLASLTGAAGIVCEPPVVQAAYDTSPDASSGEAAQFRARMDGVVASTPPIISGLAVLEVIAAGQLVGVQIETTPPYQLVINELSDIASRAERGQSILGVTEGCEAEVSPFVEPTVEYLNSLNLRGAALVGDQLKLLFALQAGFQ